MEKKPTKTDAKKTRFSDQELAEFKELILS